MKLSENTERSGPKRPSDNLERNINLEIWSAGEFILLDTGTLTVGDESHTHSPTEINNPFQFHLKSLDNQNEDTMSMTRT